MKDIEWLEDRGDWSRYATGPESSVWVCRQCGEDDETCECQSFDPYGEYRWLEDEEGTEPAAQEA